MAEPAGTPGPTLRQLRAPFSHRSIFLEWNVEPKAAFPAGTPLYALRHSGADVLPLFVETVVFGISLGLWKLAGVGRAHGFVSPEAGILVWQAPGGWRSLTAGELLGSWVSLREWQAFTAMLERHELRIRNERAGGSARAAEAETAAQAAALAKLAAGRATLADLHRQRLALLQELETANRAAAAVPTAPPPPDSAGGEDELDELLDALSPTAAELVLYAKAGGAELLKELDRALTGLAGRDAPLPVEDLLLIRAHATIVEDFADHLAVFDERIAETLADPSLDEAERQERLEKWHRMRGQLLDRI